MLKLIALGFALIAMLLGNGGVALAAPQAGAMAPLLAQATSTEFSAQQIEQFASAYEAIQSIQQDAEASMVSAVEDENLTVERFNEIADSQQNSDATVTISDTESDQFASAVEEIVSIREDAQTDMEAAIAETGMDLETFSQILTQARGDEALRQLISEQLMAE